MTLADLKAPQVLSLITDASCEEVPEGILAGWLEDDSCSKDSTCCSGNSLLPIIVYDVIMHAKVGSDCHLLRS
jgi:hypothetical protein